MASGFGFHWGASSYWADSFAKAQKEHDKVMNYCADSFLPVPSSIREFGRDDYEDTIIID